ncbi:MAG: stalk domain-containing protein [Firmicutes bacterium]|nr:stalk domain-containing protein [Bacillota bacterium]
MNGQLVTGKASINRDLPLLIQRYETGDLVYDENNFLYWGEKLLIPFMRASNWEPLRLTYRYFLTISDPSHVIISEYTYVNREYATMWRFFDKLAYFNNGTGLENYMPSTIYSSLRAAYPVITTRRTSIGRNEFQHRQFVSVEIPYGVESIYGWAFNNNHMLETIIIPRSVTFIDGFVFVDNHSLRNVYIHARNIEFDSNAFWEGWDRQGFRFRDNLTIHGYSNSDVETMARERRLNFIAFDAPAQDELISTVTRTLRFAVDNATFLDNDITHTLEAAPFIQNDRTMVPLRVISEALGAVNLTFNAGVITFVIDGQSFTMTVGKTLPGNMGMPVVVADRTFVPLAFIVSEMGATARWDSTARAAYIYVD